MSAPKEPDLERLWQCARFLPQTVRLLGTRYRLMFLAYAQQSSPAGDHPAVADALAFIEFMARQSRLSLLAPEQRALRKDGRALRLRFRLRREGNSVTAVEKWKILQWLHI